MKNRQSWLEEIEKKHADLGRQGVLSGEVKQNLDDWYRVELTYTSNAIEGNTLNRAETALVVEDGITVSGKSIREHQEAVNHARAWEYVKELVSNNVSLNERELLNIQGIVLHNIDSTNAGRYRSVPVRIAGSRAVMPNPVKVPELMSIYFDWLKKNSADPIQRACEAHYRLVTIHPFADGNGRTARLIMNYLLTEAGYPPIIVTKEDRGEYLDSLEMAQTGGSSERYYNLMLVGLSRSLDIYLEAVGKSENQQATNNADKLLKIGELARKTNESVATIRHWVKSGLIPVSQTSAGGYMLFEVGALDRVKLIRERQKVKRLSLEEIRKELG